MKLFIVFSLIFVLFIDAKVVPIDTTVISADILRDPPQATNVTVNVTWTFTDGINVTNVVMAIKNLQSSEYAALGFSQNRSMGEAHVFMCKRFPNDSIAIQRFVNPGNHTHPVPAGSEQGGIFTPLPATFMDGIVTCRFLLFGFASQKMKQPKTLRPLSQSAQYSPIFAVGMLNSTGDAQYHDGREPQALFVQLNQNQNLFYRENSTSPSNSMYPSL